jgi:hypothetical protein
VIGVAVWSSVTRDRARLGDGWELGVEWFDSAAWELKVETLIGERHFGENRIHLLSPRIRVRIQAVVRRQVSRNLRGGAGIAFAADSVEVAVVVVGVVGAAADAVAAAVGVADVVVAAAAAAVEVAVVVVLPW